MFQGILSKAKIVHSGSANSELPLRKTHHVGIHVLDRDEGPKVVLDIILSRFTKLPRFIVYDFACGLYSSAIHCLWWAIKDTTITTDNFHSNNHCCSPGFLPRAHTGLDSRNTVSHEQRNRGIKLLCKSLRNSSQRFYIGLVAYHTMVMNIRAKAKGSNEFERRGPLLSDYDIEWCYFSCLKLKCTCCEEAV